MIYVGWMILAFPIGWTISQVILVVMFFGLFTPIGLIFRLLGRDPLHRARRALTGNRTGNPSRHRPTCAAISNSFDGGLRSSTLHLSG